MMRLMVVMMNLVVVYGRSTQNNRYLDKGIKPVTVDWAARGRQELEDALKVEPLVARAKNVIIFLGDGMNIATTTASRIYKAQQRGQSATEGSLSWESMPYTGFMKAYNTDQIAGDSAGCASAIFTGEKTRHGVISVNQHVPPGNCTAQKGNELTSLLHYAIKQGKWAGLVSTDTVTSASMAPAFAHAAERGWTANVPEPYTDSCWDIARQLVHSDVNKYIRVIQGGGRRYLRPQNYTDPESGEKSRRLDNHDLVQDWLDIHREMGHTDEEVVFARNTAEFNNIDGNVVQYLLGLYSADIMKFEADRRKEDPNDEWNEPSLAQMVEKSLEVLSRSPDGYVLFAEGGLIDNGHHANQAHIAILETLAFEESVQVAMERTDPSDTLILALADHSNVFMLTGYAKLDTNILGLVVNQSDQTVLADDGKPYPLLAYYSGPGYKEHRMVDDTDAPRMDLTGVDTTGEYYVSDAAVPLPADTHSGEDTLMFARGPMAHLFTGLHEQNYLGHAIMYAACLGPNTSLCGTTDSAFSPQTDGSTAAALNYGI